MKIVLVLLVLLIGAALKAYAENTLVDNIYYACNHPPSKCEEGPYCFSYSKKNAGADDVCDQVGKFNSYETLTCPILGYFKRADNGNFIVKLVGSVSGSGGAYVGIVFGPRTGDISNDGVFGVACRSDNKTVVLKPPITESGPLTVDKGSKAVEHGRVTIEKSWISCEFELMEKPLAGLDLSKGQYKVGLVRGEVKSDGKIYGGPLTSHAEALEALSHLKPVGGNSNNEDKDGKDGGGGGGNGAATAITLIAIGLALLLTFSKTYQ